MCGGQELTATASRTSLRRATPEDLPAIAKLLSERDGHELRTQDVTAALCNLDQELAAMWLGMVGDEPGASTAVYLRRLHLPQGAEPMPIGYWAHLFVLPEHRRLMLYPQLVFTMRRAMAELGIQAIITAMRRPAVTEGHLKLGFKAVCAWPVLLKPLRPFSLLAKHKGSRAAAIAAPVGDLLWRRGQALRHRVNAPGLEVVNAEQVRQDPRLVREIAGLIAACRGDRFGTEWTPQLLAARLAGGVDGEPYRIALTRDGQAIQGVAVYRLASRGNDIRTGVVLELASRNDDQHVLKGLALLCERELHGAGAEAILWLDGAGHITSSALRGLGYRPAPDETYRLIAYTADRADMLLPSDADGWRFTFLDHDAF